MDTSEGGRNVEWMNLAVLARLAAAQKVTTPLINAHPTAPDDELKERTAYSRRKLIDISTFCRTNVTITV